MSGTATNSGSDEAPWDASAPSHEIRRYSQPMPGWKPGGGANHLAKNSGSKDDDKTGRLRHISIDPSSPSRSVVYNYQLLISAITPRPIAFVSSYYPGPDGGPGGDAGNLAPFSYFSVVNHDPPLFTIGFASPMAAAAADGGGGEGGGGVKGPAPEKYAGDGIKKDTLRNLVATRECVINIVSEHFLEAANSTSVNSPPPVDEWDLSGLTKRWDCVETPRCPRVEEAVFSVECRVVSLTEYGSRRQGSEGKKTGTLAVLEGFRFWCREDAAVAAPGAGDEAGGHLHGDKVAGIKFDVLRPVSRLGGASYGLTRGLLDIKRPDFEKDIGGLEGLEAAKERTRARMAEKTSSL